jgi:hypothetical protein
MAHLQGKLCRRVFIPQHPEEACGQGPFKPERTGDLDQQGPRRSPISKYRFINLSSGPSIASNFRLWVISWFSLAQNLKPGGVVASHFPIVFGHGKMTETAVDFGAVKMLRIKGQVIRRLQIFGIEQPFPAIRPAESAQAEILW